MKNALLFATTLMTIGCGTKNACEELSDAVCACDGVECSEPERDPADATDEEIEFCQAVLDSGVDVCSDGLEGGEYESGWDTGI